jgi:PAS domain S-box-containing protein
MPTPDENNLTDINRNPFHLTYRIRHRSGEWRWVDEWGTGVENPAGKVEFLEGIMIDITERKQAEEQRKNHVRFLESMDKVNRAMQSANDLEWVMNDVLDLVLSIFDCDRTYLGYPCNPESPSWSLRAESTRPEYPGLLALGVDEVPIDADARETFRILLNTDGPATFGPGNSHPLPANATERFGLKSFMSMAFYPKVGEPWQFGIHQCSYARVWTSEDERLFHEIGRRLSDVLTVLLTYLQLQESEERYRQLVNLSPEAIAIFKQGRIVFANPAAVRIVGAKSEEDFLGRSILDFIHPDFRESVMEQMARLTTGISTPFIEEKFLRLDGLNVDVEVAVVAYQREGVEYMQIVARDITERKHHELEREAIITVSQALRKATAKTEILTVILDQLIDLFQADGAVLVLPDPQTGGFIDEMGRGSVGERMIGLNIPPERGVANWVIKNKKPYLNNRADDDPLFYRPDLLGDSHCLAAVPLIAQELAIGALWIVRQVNILEQDLRLLNAIADIAANAIHRVILHEQTELQLHHLIALHQIDLAISANFDLNVTLNVILKNVKDELEVDAASILLLDSVTHTLDYAAGIGFRTRRIEQSHVKLGNGCAGRAAQEYRTISYPDLNQAPGTFSRSALLVNEEFLSHYATPLIVKGQVKGVLEIFHRKRLEAEQEWINYLETLATQAAIAIESTSLFENLQRSNMELMLAYDATIEGWSRALDLRDRETEGHTQRVTEMVLGLAEKMGVSDAEKMDLRRGALLHDIGKMGVPDSILLKAGSLSESEWEIMRQHPFYAFQMLSPISYLKHALDIPYCHHEKWDGSGYPRGLKGEEIPLSARMFSVVDVFDALTSDRPYRAAWPPEKGYRFIQKQAGIQFDPRVVKIFLEGR